MQSEPKSQPPRLRLYVLPPSHFCERARWALDAAGIPFEEVAWPVGPHAVLARRIAPASTLPILVTGSGVVQGSGRILDWTRMPGGDDLLEARFETVIGPLVRRYVYSGVLGDARSGIKNALFAGVGTGMSLAGRLMWPVTRRIMRSRMDARSELSSELAAQLDSELDGFEGRLAGRRYLLDRFGRADLTAASLLAPLARPVGAPDYARVKVPAEMEAALRSWSDRPAIAYTRRIYADHRTERAQRIP